MKAELFIQALKERATKRTKRYFLDDSFVDAAKDVWYTYEMIKSLGYDDANLEVDGEFHKVSSYRFPTNMVKCLEACRVVVNPTSIGKNAYYYKFTLEKDSKRKLVSPDTVRRFFANFSATQAGMVDESISPIETVNVQFHDASLMQFRCLLSDDGLRFVDWNEGGEYDEFIAYFNDVRINFGDTVNQSFDTHHLPNKESLSKWLIS